jgi:hypothetical protein
MVGRAGLDSVNNDRMALIMTAVYGRAGGSEPADRLRRIWPFGQ